MHGGLVNIKFHVVDDLAIMISPVLGFLTQKAALVNTPLLHLQFTA